MKVHTSDFKNQIKTFGKQIDSKITYTIDEEEIELGAEELNSITPYFKSSILKSVMKQLDVDSNVEIPIDTIINYKFGLLVNNEYEYIDFGNYIVQEVEKQEDTNSYMIKCYDKMLYAMKEYENLGISYPITIKDYLTALCTKLGLTLETTLFVNDTKQIQSERYLDSEGNSLGYTYRDVLDEIAEVTASTILINNDDKLELRYIESEQYEEKTVEAKNELYIPDAKEQENIINYSVDGATEQDGTPTPDNPVEVKTIPSIINLFDKDNANVINCSMSSSAIANSSSARMIYIPITGGKTYTISKIKSARFRVATTETTPASGVTISNYSSSDNSTLITITTNTSAKYICAYIYISTADTLTPEEIINTIMIEESSVAHEYVPYGYWSKVKVTGKNVFNMNRHINTTYHASGTIDGNSLTINTNGNYARVQYDFPELIAGKKYTLTASYNNPNGNSIRIAVFEGSTEKSSTAVKNDTSGGYIYTFTANSNTTIRFYSNALSSGVTTPMTYYNIQLEEGNQTTAYEPYKENQVLIDMSKTNMITTLSANWGSTSNGNINQSAGTQYFSPQEKIEVKPNTTYSIIFDGYVLNKTDPTVLNFSEYNDSGTFIRRNTSLRTPTFTTGSTTKYIFPYLFNTNGIFTTTGTKIYLFESNNVTPYYELCKIGDYKDTLSIDSSGNVVVNKNIGKVVLNGSESWSIAANSGAGSGTYRFYINRPSGSTSSTKKLYSNYFAPSSVYSEIDNSIYFGGSTLLISRVKSNNSYIETTSDFKTWLSTHNTSVYYVLATPETINLPNTKIPLFEGINHVTFVDDLETDTKIIYNTPEITGEIIDEEYLKDTNVNFGEKYGTINTIVLSRSAGADKISQSIPSDLPDDEKVAIVIEDNQILNGNDRDTFIPEILNKLYGLSYNLNDYSSTGITYLDICDRYYVRIGETLYPCIMFNDEINVTQGLQEFIHTEMPEYSETDYKKTDKTDQKINQTYLIVDKQNQTIESVVSNVTEQNSKISQITQTVDEINQKIGEITDITVSGESLVGDVLLNQVNASEPITIKVRPLNINNNISYLYPNSSLYPSNTLYSKNRKVRFIRTYTEEGQTYTENIDYELPDDLLYYDSTHYDEFYLNYDSQTCEITKKCKYNSDGTVGLLSQEEVITYPYPTINLGDGDYEIKLLGYDVGYLFVTLMASNIYTTQFATKVEMESSISQTAQEIDLSVNQKLTNYSTTTEMNSAINVKANEINSVVSTKVGNNEIISKINQTSEQITISANKINIAGTISAINNNTTTTINGDKISTGTINANKIVAGSITATEIANATITGTKIADATITSAKISSVNADKITAGTITTSSINLGNGKFSVNTSGYLRSTSGTIGGWTISSSSLSVTWGSYTIQLASNGITASYSGGSITASWYEILRRLGFLP